jgi:hypothetical protein
MLEFIRFFSSINETVYVIPWQTQGLPRMLFLTLTRGRNSMGTPNPMDTYQQGMQEADRRVMSGANAQAQAQTQSMLAALKDPNGGFGGFGGFGSGFGGFGFTNPYAPQPTQAQIPVAQPAQPTAGETAEPAALGAAGSAAPGALPGGAGIAPGYVGNFVFGAAAAPVTGLMAAIDAHNGSENPTGPRPR